MSVNDATLPDLSAAGLQPQAAPQRTLDLPEVALAAFIVALFGVIFAFDVATPADHVSVSFLYAIPLFIAVFGRAQPVYAFAALATVLSVLGIFIQPPEDIATAAFYANRTIAITALWIVAGLIATRKKTEALIRANFEEEKRKAEYRRRFLDVLSHEIGTSLTVIDGHAFRMRNLAGANAPPDIQARTEKIHRAVRHIESMVRRVQLASEAGQRTLQPRFARVDLRALIGESVQHVRDGGQAPPIEAELAGLPDAVPADRYMLRHVIDNLLSNAVKYSPADAPIRISGRTERGHAVIAVIDRGRGIPEDEQKMLFGPYYRASNSRGIHGAGIGLYVCERFVAGHCGTIDIHSTLGAGTTVTVRIPAGAKTSSESNAKAAHPLH